MGDFIIQLSVTVGTVVLVDRDFVLPGPQILPVDVPIQIRIAVAQ